jgi:hypothetical protein
VKPWDASPFEVFLARFDGHKLVQALSQLVIRKRLPAMKIGAVRELDSFHATEEFETRPDMGLSSNATSRIRAGAGFFSFSWIAYRLALRSRAKALPDPRSQPVRCSSGRSGREPEQTS